MNTNSGIERVEIYFPMKSLGRTLRQILPEQATAMAIYMPGPGLEHARMPTFSRKNQSLRPGGDINVNSS